MMVIVRRLMLAICVLTPFLGGHASADGSAFPVELDPSPIKRITPADDPYYGPPRAALTRLVRAEKRNRTSRHFCVVGYARPDNQVAVWVHWREQRRLLLWRENADPAVRVKGLQQAQRNLKLGRDTVENATDIQGSTYRVTRAWWQAMAKDCAAHGQQFVVRPAKNP